MRRLAFCLLVLLAGYPTHAQWGPYMLDTISFEEPYEYLVIDTLPGNIWQIGPPEKVIFDSAFTLPNAIVTDKLNTYPVGNHSRFILKIGEFNYEYYYPYNIFMEITHKYHTDTLMDGGYITVSYDNGLSWMNIINDTVYEEMTPAGENENLYSEMNTLYNGEYGFSGNSRGWVTTWYTWHSLPVDHMWEPGDTMMIGFNFISDSIETNKDGWMIDNIILYAEDLGGSIDEHAIPDVYLYPNPARDRISISSSADLNGAEVIVFDVLGQAHIKETMQYNTINVSTLPAGSYFLYIKTNEGSIKKKFVITSFR